MHPAARERRQATVAIAGGCLVVGIAAGACVFGLLLLGQPEGQVEQRPWRESRAPLPADAGEVVVAVRRTNRVDGAQDRELRVVSGPHVGMNVTLPHSPGGRNWLNLYYYPPAEGGALLAFVDSFGTSLVELESGRGVALCRYGEGRRAFPILPRLSPCQRVTGEGEEVPARVSDLDAAIYVGRFEDPMGAHRFVPAAEAQEEPRRRSSQSDGQSDGQ